MLPGRFLSHSHGPGRAAGFRQPPTQLPRRSLRRPPLGLPPRGVLGGAAGSVEREQLVRWSGLGRRLCRAGFLVFRVAPEDREVVVRLVEELPVTLERDAPEARPAESRGAQAGPESDEGVAGGPIAPLSAPGRKDPARRRRRRGHGPMEPRSRLTSVWRVHNRSVSEIRWVSGSAEGMR